MAQAGAIRSQVNGGPVTTYTAGRSFSELPGDHHDVSANASETQPANPTFATRAIGSWKYLFFHGRGVEGRHHRAAHHDGYGTSAAITLGGD
jgi:hypothetical protein